MDSKYEFMTFYDALWRSTWISALFGIVSFLLVHFRPYQVVPWTILLGGIATIVFALIILMYSLPKPASPTATSSSGSSSSPSSWSSASTLSTPSGTTKGGSPSSRVPD